MKNKDEEFSDSTAYCWSESVWYGMSCPLFNILPLFLLNFGTMWILNIEMTEVPSVPIFIKKQISPLIVFYVLIVFVSFARNRILSQLTVSYWPWSNKRSIQQGKPDWLLYLHNTKELSDNPISQSQSGRLQWRNWNSFFARIKGVWTSNHAKSYLSLLACH